MARGPRLYTRVPMERMPATHLQPPCHAVAFEAAVARSQFLKRCDYTTVSSGRGLRPGAPEFERWCEQERQRLRGLASQAGWSRAQGAMRDRRPKEGCPLRSLGRGPDAG